MGNLPNLAQACRYAFENYEYDARSIIVANEFDDHLWNRYLFVEGILAGTVLALLAVMILLAGENIYEISQYDVYIGGDYGVTTQTCENAPCDKKILIIKDSYSRPVMAFMGTVFSQVDTIDMRYFEGDVQSYIEQVQPDMVMVIYNPYMLDESSFAFGFEGQ